MTCNSTPTVGSRRRAKKLNLEIDQGAVFNLPILYREDGVAVDLTGATAAAQFREKINSTSVVIGLTTAAGGLVVDGAAGRITMHIPATVTAALRVYKGVWDMLVTLADGEKFTMLTGEWKVRRGVTR